MQIKFHFASYHKEGNQKAHCIKLAIKWKTLSRLSKFALRKRQHVISHVKLALETAASPCKLSLTSGEYLMGPRHGKHLIVLPAGGSEDFVAVSGKQILFAMLNRFLDGFQSIIQGPITPISACVRRRLNFVSTSLNLTLRDSKYALIHFQLLPSTSTSIILF